MSYIGNQPTSAAFVTDYFSGNGSTVAYTMSVAPANTSSMLVTVSGVAQNPDTYSINATTLTFSAAPPAGTGNICVRYLGIPASNVTTTAYRTVTDFTATAGQTTFSPPSYTVGYIDVYQNGVRLGAADYTATNGTTIVLAVGANLNDLITTQSFYVSSVLNAIPAVAGGVGSSFLANGAATQIFLDSASGTGTGALKLPVGTTAQRPTGATGLIRQNSTTGNPEWWDVTTNLWLPFSQNAGYSIEYLVVAGGGGGGQTIAGGGGAGGFLAATTSLTAGNAYTITVGAGGAGSTAGTAPGASGSNSVLGSLVTALGGGGGASTSTGGASTTGGSGGGGCYNTNLTGAAGTVGQGYAGGGSVGQVAGGGGGGAGAVGSNAVSANIGGNGGLGAASSISGSSLNYAGGGGGGSNAGAGTVGLGTSGGGNGAGSSLAGTAGTANTGGGGGGGGNISTSSGYAGGSGIVILRYLGSQRGTGGTITSSGGYTIHTFTSSGTYTA